MHAFATPIIFAVFNRPAATRRVLARIREVRPRRLHIIADGPRPNHFDDAVRCREVRANIEELLDWKCEVSRDYAGENLGCGRRLATGLTAAFAELGEAIVVEDDVLPHVDFFAFCAQMLARYRDAPEVHAINGFNPLGRYAPRRGDFVPSVFNSVWGWASWQRAWADYQYEMDDWYDPAVQETIREFVRLPLIHQHFAQHFEQVCAGLLDTWDYQWCFAQLRRRRVALVSAVNFVENIGFDQTATHTLRPPPFLRGLPTYSAGRAAQSKLPTDPDPVFDRLCAEVYLTDSPLRVTAARFAAARPFTHSFIARTLR